MSQDLRAFVGRCHVNLPIIRGERLVNLLCRPSASSHATLFLGKFGMKVKRCFSFSDTNNTVQLVDDRG